MAQSLEEKHSRLTELGFDRTYRSSAFLKEAEAQKAELREMADRIEQSKTFAPEIDSLFNQPFRVLEFEQRRFFILRELEELSAETDARLPENFGALVPAFKGATTNTNQLWLDLEFFNHVTSQLLSSGNGVSIDVIELLEARRFDWGDPLEDLSEIRCRVRANGPASALATFLNASALESLDNDDKQSAAFFIKRIQISYFESEAGAENDRLAFDLQLSGFSTIPKMQ